MKLQLVALLLLILSLFGDWGTGFSESFLMQLVSETSSGFFLTLTFVFLLITTVKGRIFPLLSGFGFFTCLILLFIVLTIYVTILAFANYDILKLGFGPPLALIALLLLGYSFLLQTIKLKHKLKK